MKKILALAMAWIGLSMAGTTLDVEAQQRRLEIIEEVNSMQTTWKAGINPRFDGASKEFVKRQLGSFEDKDHSRYDLLPKIEHNVDASAIPTAFDWRQTAGTMCPSVNVIRDQSNCGSCWAFGAAESATDRLCIQTNGGKQFMIGAADILSCCSTCGSGCNGGYPSQAWHWLTTTGAVTGGNYQDYSWCWSYPYPTCEHHNNKTTYVQCSSLPSYPTPTCKKSCDTQTTYKTAYSSDKHTFSTSYGVPQNVSQIQTDLMTYGPQEVSFSVYEDFETYTSGIYVHKTGQYLGGHAVKFMGWGVGSASEGNQPYWIVANSWNNDWGENGYFRILRGVNECGIEGSVVAGKV
jgi:cathepsin B